MTAPDRLTITGFPDVWVDIACEQCERRGRLRRDRLATKYGADIALPDLLSKIAEDAGCDRVGKWHTPCGAYYVALRPE